MESLLKLTKQLGLLQQFGKLRGYQLSCEHKPAYCIPCEQIIIEKTLLVPLQKLVLTSEDLLRTDQHCIVL